MLRSLVGSEMCIRDRNEHYSKVLSLPHSSTFFCLVCVTLPSFSSFSLYVVPSFCRFLSTFVLPHFCRYCRRSSRVAAVFLCLALFVLLSVLLADICARHLPFFCCFLLLIYCSTITESLLYVQQLHERQGHNQDLHRQNQGRRSRGQALGQPLPPPLLLQAAVDRHHRQHPRHKKKHKELGTTHEQESAKPSVIVPDTFKDF